MKENECISLIHFIYAAYIILFYKLNFLAYSKTKLSCLPWQIPRMVVLVEHFLVLFCLFWCLFNLWSVRCQRTKSLTMPLFPGGRTDLYKSQSQKECPGLSACMNIFLDPGSEDQGPVVMNRS